MKKYLKDLENVIITCEEADEKIEKFSDEFVKIEKERADLDEELAKMKKDSPQYKLKLSEIKKRENRIKALNAGMSGSEKRKEKAFDTIKNRVENDIKDSDSKISFNNQKNSEEEAIITKLEFDLQNAKNQNEKDEIQDKIAESKKVIDGYKNENKKISDEVDEMKKFISDVEGSKNDLQALRNTFGINKVTKNNPEKQDIVNENNEETLKLEEKPADISMVSGTSEENKMKRWVEYQLADGTKGKIDLDECMKRKNIKKLYEEIDLDAYFEESDIDLKTKIKAIKSLNPAVIKAFYENGKMDELENYIVSSVNEEKDSINIEYDLSKTNNKKGSLKKLNDAVAKDMYSVGANAIGVEKTRTVKKLLKKNPDLLEQNKIYEKEEDLNKQFRTEQQVQPTQMQNQQQNEQENENTIRESEHTR